MIVAPAGSGEAAAESLETEPGQRQGEVDRGLDQLEGPVAARGLVGDGLWRAGYSFLAISGPVMRASSGKVAAMMPRDTRIPPAVMR
jgi:hypothetical protein